HALVHPEPDPVVLGPPALPLLGSAALQCDLQQLLPEAPRPFGLIGGELDQKPRRHRFTPYPEPSSHDYAATCRRWFARRASYIASSAILKSSSPRPSTPVERATPKL